MRTLTDHIVEGDIPQNQLTIQVTDQPGAGGASHRYEITGFDTKGNETAIYQGGFSCGTSSRAIILFQNGPIKEFGVNGITQEALLAIVIDRLRSFQKGPFACDANEFALQSCEEALIHLKTRTRERIERRVEGTTKA